MTQTGVRHPGVGAHDVEKTQRREEHVLRKPPHIAPLDVDAIADAAVESTRRIRQAAGSTTPVSAATIPELVSTLMRHPDLFQRVADLSIQLQGRGVLAPRDRQLAILRTTWLCQAPYAWGEHVVHSKRIVLRVRKLSASPKAHLHQPGVNTNEPFSSRSRSYIRTP